MSAGEHLRVAAIATAWTPADQLALTCEYIDRQHDDDAFAEFVAEEAARLIVKRRGEQIQGARERIGKLRKEVNHRILGLKVITLLADLREVRLFEESDLVEIYQGLKANREDPEKVERALQQLEALLTEADAANG